MENYFHHASGFIVANCLKHSIGKIIIGKNDGWKTEMNLGKKTNQHFQYIPFTNFLQKIKYKADLAGIEVVFTEEANTSKCSFLDNESIEHHDEYRGKRPKRGYFVTKDGIEINADVNAAANIAKKCKQWLKKNERLCTGLTLNPRRVRIDHAPFRTKY